jgi:Protein of unknown function (DUF998)
LLLSTVILDTVWSRGFLRRAPWSPVHRSVVEWPSILLLGPHGTTLAVTFVVVAALEVLFVYTLPRVLPAAGAPTSAFLLVGSTALGFVAFAPGRETLGIDATWSRRIHNTAYPVMLVALFAAMVVVAWAIRGRPSWRALHGVTVACCAVTVVSIPLSGVDAVSQAARYPLFAALLIWLESLALVGITSAENTSDSRCSTS